MRTRLATDAQGRFETGPIDAEIDVTLHLRDTALAEVLATVPLRLRPGEDRTVDVGAPGTVAPPGEDRPRRRDRALPHG